MIKREKYLEKIERILDLRKSVFLVGARQVGKTSLMKYVGEKEKSFYMNFDEIVSSGLIEFQNLQEFIDYINAYFGVNIENFDLLLFDEVVRVKNFNIILKAFLDKFENKKVIASASGNYDIIGEIIDGLAGRIIKVEVFPLDFKEFLFFKGKNINLDNITENIFNLIKTDLLEFLTFGSYPEVVLEKNYENKKLLLKSIVDSVFDKDLKKFISNEEILDIEKLINYLSNNIGSLFSYEGLAEILSIKLKDIKFYLDLLEKSYLIFRLNPFFTNKKEEYSQKQKIYFNNFGTINYFSGNLNLKQFISGIDVEQTLFLNLRFNLELNDKLYFYQKLNGSEIDFILHKNGKIFPIEAKTSNRDNIPRIFNSFLEKYDEQIGNFYKTTTSLNFIREYKKGKKVIGKPFYALFI